MHKHARRLTHAFVLACTAGLVAGCAVAPAESDPTEAASAQYLFGFSRDQILRMKDPLAHQMSDEQWLAANEGSFECARFGQLCEITGEAAAERVIRSSYDKRLAGATIQEIDAYLKEAIAEAQAAWDAPEADPDARSTTSGYVDNGSSSKRVRIRLYTVYPIVGTAYAKGDCTYQEKDWAGIWWNHSAEHTAKVRSHVYQYFRFGTTITDSEVDWEPSSSNHSEYMTNTDTAEVVEVGNLYESASYDWGLESGSSWDTFATIVGRACCNSNKGSWSTGGTWCIGDG